MITHVVKLRLCSSWGARYGESRLNRSRLAAPWAKV